KQALSGIQKEGFRDAYLKRLRPPQPFPSITTLDGETQTFNAEAPEASPTTPSAPQMLGGFKIDLGGLVLEGDNRVQFIDQGVSPLFRQELVIKTLKLGRISNQPGTKTPFQLKASIGQYGSGVALQGDIQLFSAKPTMEIKGKLKAIDLPPFSSYSAPISGYELVSGAADADLNITILQGNIKGAAELKLRNLSVTAADPNLVKETEKKINAPLETALDLLRDNKGDISLTLPVSGTTQAPKIDPGDAIAQATASVVKSTAVTALKVAVMPVGVLLTASDLVGAVMDQVNLKPVPWPPGSDQLVEKAKQPLSEIAKTLEKQNDLRLKLCGFAVEADRKSLLAGGKTITDEQLLQLAKRRSAKVKALLVTQHKIDPSRLFECMPELDHRPKGEARVEVEK
ncbi:MAG: DUF748 domain-containing protein, partial [Magnetococcales bacterium]|nr:DUF748 domain-containing protein [Magnetococcales bacterium]